MLTVADDRQGITFGVAIGSGALELVGHKMVEDVPVSCSFQSMFAHQMVDCSRFENCSLFEDLQWDLCTWVQGLEPPQSGGLDQKEVEACAPLQV